MGKGVGSKVKNILNRRFVQQVIDCMAEGVFTLDEGGRITSWNPAMEKITGYTAEAALGKTCCSSAAASTRYAPPG